MLDLRHLSGMKMTDFTKQHLTAIRAELGKISALSDHTTETILGNLGNAMTEQTYTKEQIEAAIGAALRDPQKTMSLFDYTMAELTNPAPVFKVGEVVVSEHSNNLFWWKEASPVHENTYRHLTPEEVPALKAAIEALDEARVHTEHYVQTGIEQALDDIKAML